MGWDSVQRTLNDPKRYKLPFYPGDRVCVNPETGIYANIKADFGDIGTVINISGGTDLLSQWHILNLNEKQKFRVTVRFDKTGKALLVKTMNLLAIDAPQKTIEEYLLESGEVFYIIDDEDNPILTELIVKRRLNIERISVYNETSKEAKHQEILLNYETIG